MTAEVPQLLPEGEDEVVVASVKAQYAMRADNLNAPCVFMGGVLLRETDALKEIAFGGRQGLLQLLSQSC